MDPVLSSAPGRNTLLLRHCNSPSVSPPASQLPADGADGVGHGLQGHAQLGLDAGHAARGELEVKPLELALTEEHMSCVTGTAAASTLTFI